MADETKHLFEREKLKRRLSRWRVVAIAVLVILGYIVIGMLGDPRGEDHVARINIDDLIMDDPDMEARIREAADNENTKAIVLRINSGGGASSASEAWYEAVRYAADQKPVVAVITSLGASGAYVVAMGADRIFAAQTSLVGSIGVYFESPEFSGLLEKAGVGFNAVTSGGVKNEPNLHSPLTEEAREAIREMVLDTYDWFVSLFAERRGLEKETALALADGRVFTGRKALDLKLVDQLGGETDALNWLVSESGIDPELPLVDLDDYYNNALFTAAKSAFPLAFSAERRLRLDGLLTLWQP